jgi:signal transduction histidine kinase
LNHTRELTGCRKDGSTFPMEVAIGEVDLGDRRLFTAIIRDITEREQMERERERRKDELEQAVRERTAELERTSEQLRSAKDAADAAMRTQETFLSGVAHDLRTPLACVIGYSEDLLEQAVDVGLDDFIADLRLVVNQGRYLNELVIDLLSMNEAINGRSVKLDVKPSTSRRCCVPAWRGRRLPGPQVQQPGRARLPRATWLDDRRRGPGLAGADEPCCPTP